MRRFHAVSLMLTLTAAVAAWIGATGLGVVTELMQRLQPTRVAEVSDVLADAVGAAVVVLVCLAMRRFGGLFPIGAPASLRRFAACVSPPAAGGEVQPALETGSSVRHIDKEGPVT